MKIKLDENLDSSLATYLKKAGHDTTTVLEQNLNGIEDESLYEICKLEKRILVSFDMDFSNVLRYPPYKTAGIIIIRGTNYLFATTRILIKTLIDALSKESPVGKLWIVELGRIRIHEEKE